MQFLTDHSRVLGVVALAIVGLLLTAGQSAAHPPPNPDHGLNETTFYSLWSGDADDANRTELVQDGAGSETPMAVLANGTDIPFSAPPQAVEQWNRGDHDEFPATGGAMSVYPTGATREQGTFIKDAHTTIFTIQPATRTRLSPDDTRQYVAPEGELHATTDYRVTVPPNQTTGDVRRYWRLVNHSINVTELTIDERTEVAVSGSRTPRLEYDLDGYPGETHTVTISANITAEVWTRTERCSEYDNESNCLNWTASESSLTERVSPSDSIDVRSYDLGISGFYTRFPDGDLGLVVFKSEPWAGYSVGDDRARGVWRFYTARDQSWDQIVTQTDSGFWINHSEQHPLSVTAYPSRPGPTVAPSASISLTKTYGETLSPPQLPPNITLDTVSEPYTASDGLVTRIDTADGIENLTAYGIVRGVSASDTSNFVEIEHRRSNLTLSVVNTTAETATIQLRLRDADTGSPINTTDREGALTFGGERVNTTGAGTVTRTVPRSTGSISASYEPGDWWYHDPSYVGDDDTVAFQSGGRSFLEILFRLGILVSLFSLAVFLIDRITDWDVWPFWRGL